MEAVEQNRTLPAFSIRQFVVRYGVYVSLAVLLLISVVATPELYKTENIFLVLRQASQLGLVAIGQTLVLIAAGLDLSVGGVIVLTSITIAQVAGTQDALLPGAILKAFALGAVVGLGNGLLITKRNVPPFVATLGVLVLTNGALLASTRGVPSGQVPPALGVLNQSVGQLPISISVVLWVGFTVLINFILTATPYGRRVFAVGSNREAARLSGINVERVIIGVYVACSLMAVVGGIVLSSYVGYVDRYLGRGLELDSIAAAVVGGTAFTGGRGSLAGTMAGVIIIQLLTYMTRQLGWNPQLQLAVKGLVIIAAVALYSIAARNK